MDLKYSDTKGLNRRMTLVDPSKFLMTTDTEWDPITKLNRRTSDPQPYKFSKDL